MTKIDPIIAVNDVDNSAKWYESIFGFKNSSPEGHGFAVLKSETNEIVLCLHQWEMDDHPTMTDPSITPGNGLMLYFRTKNLDTIYQKVKNAGCGIEKDIHLNPRPMKKEFSLRDPDGYFLTVSDFTHLRDELNKASCQHCISVMRAGRLKMSIFAPNKLCGGRIVKCSLIPHYVYTRPL